MTHLSRTLGHAPATPVLQAALMICGLIVASQPVRAVEDSRAESTSVKVSWDFGSGPGKTSTFYVGEKAIQARYDTPDCAARFTLEAARYEFAAVAGSTSNEQGPPFIMFTLRKHFVGDFELLPKLTITQSGKSTKQKTTVVFPFREKKMALPVPDWSLADIEIRIGAPGAIMDLHNPYDWSAIEVACK